MRTCYYSAAIIASLALAPAWFSNAGDTATAQENDPAGWSNYRQVTKRDTLGPIDKSAYQSFCLRLYLDLKGTLPAPIELRDFLAGDGMQRAATVENVLTEAAKKHRWSSDRQNYIRTRVLASLLSLDKAPNSELPFNYDRQEAIDAAPKEQNISGQGARNARHRYSTQYVKNRLTRTGHEEGVNDSAKAPGPEDAHCLEFSPDGKQLIRRVALFSPDGKLLKTQDNAGSAEFSSDGKRLIRCTAFSPEGAKLLSNAPAAAP